MKNNYKSFFLPYQLRWLNDKSKVKIWEKSRRIGATYVQSYEDVRDCVYKRVPAVWFSSADESAAREYIDYCEQWTKLFNVAAKSLGEVIIDNDKDIKAFVIEFNNGTKIHALSSNPKGFRSKGGSCGKRHDHVLLGDTRCGYFRHITGKTAYIISSLTKY